MNVDDPLKPINEIFKADRDFYGESIEDRHKAVSSIVVNEAVPKDVAQLIETAKNLSLYSYYAYRFHQPAELMGFIAFELALKEKAALLGVKVKPNTLAGHINYAIEHKWVDSSLEAELIEKALHAARRLRNSLAHGKRYLAPISISSLTITVETINMLFEDEKFIDPKNDKHSKLIVTIDSN